MARIKHKVATVFVAMLLAVGLSLLAAQQTTEPWRVLGAGAAYSVGIDTTVARSGTQSARITGRDATATGLANVFQRVRADQYRGRRVRLSAFVKTDDVRGEGVFIRIRAQRERTTDVATSDSVLGTRDWVQISTELDIPADSFILNLVAGLAGRGTAWIDDVSLEPVGGGPQALAATSPPPPPMLDLYAATPAVPDALGFEGVRLLTGTTGGLRTSPAEPPRPTTVRGLDNLVAFAHLFGFVRHFVPTEAVRTTNWEEFAMRGVRVIESASNPEELVKQLQAIFSPVAPDVRVHVTNAARPSEVARPNPEGSPGIATWVNTSIGSEGCDQFLNFRSELVVRPAPGRIVPANTPDPSRPWSGPLAGGVSALVPVARWVTLPVDDALRCRPVQPAAPVEAASADDRATRLARVIIAWNVIQHSYPYFDVVKTDWSAALRAALASSATDSTPAGYLTTLERMTAALNDGHGQVFWASPMRQTAYLPVRFDWVEEQLVVDVVASDAAALIHRGDTVVTLDGLPVESALRNRERTISGATPQWRRYRAVNELEVGALRTAVTLGVRPAGGGALREVKLSYEGPMLALPRPEKIADLKSGVVYVDLSRITPDDFITALPTLRAAKGIVFDMRGSASLNVRDFLPWLSSGGVRLDLSSQADATGAGRGGIPTFSRPFLEDAVWFAPRASTLPPQTPHIGAKTAFLAGAGAISAAETILSAVEQNRLGEIVGSTTAGTNGNVNGVKIPGGFTIWFTAYRVTRPDGSPHHGVGIKPTVPAARTLMGVAEGRDEVLEKGIAVVSRLQSQR